MRTREEQPEREPQAFLCADVETGHWGACLRASVDVYRMSILLALLDGALLLLFTGGAKKV